MNEICICGHENKYHLDTAPTFCIFHSNDHCLSFRPEPLKENPSGEVYTGITPELEPMNPATVRLPKDFMKAPAEKSLTKELNRWYKALPNYPREASHRVWSVSPEELSDFIANQIAEAEERGMHKKDNSGRRLFQEGYAQARAETIEKAIEAIEHLPAKTFKNPATKNTIILALKSLQEPKQ